MRLTSTRKFQQLATSSVHKGQSKQSVVKKTRLKSNSVLDRESLLSFFNASLLIKGFAGLFRAFQGFSRLFGDF